MGRTAEFNHAKPSVLIVDDDYNVVRFLAVRCAKLGLEVRTAGNGLQALVMVKQSRPDVLIVDVNMPELDGLSLCLHLLRPESRSLDVIVVSGAADSEARERCGGFGASFVSKGPALWPQVSAMLNVRFPALAEPAPFVAPAATEQVAPQPPRVLIVDDDPDVGSFLGSRLRKLGIEPIFAKDGADGFRLAQRCRPRVILSDCYMPNGDISYLIARVRSTPGIERIPVLAMSARPLHELEDGPLLKDILGRAGPDAIFTKPLDMEHLFGTIRQLIAA